MHTPRSVVMDPSSALRDCPGVDGMQCARRCDRFEFQTARQFLQMHVRDPAARMAPGLCVQLAPRENRGRRECRTLDAPAAACVLVESTRVSHHGHTGNTRHSPRNGFTAYSALSLVTGLSCHHRLANTSAKLDASVGASGPHDFAVREKCLRLWHQLRPPHPVPNVRDDRETPLEWARDDQGYATDLGQARSGIFLAGGLDGEFNTRIDLPVGNGLRALAFSSLCRTPHIVGERAIGQRLGQMQPA